CLTGCSSLLGPQEQPATSTYTLSIPRIHNVPPANKPLTLMVTTPTASSGYTSKKMIYNQLPYELSSYSRNEWAGPPAEMLEPLLIQKLRDTGYFHAVVTTPFFANRELVLKTHLLELRQDFTTKPSRIILAVQVELINNRTEHVINSHTFSCSIPTHCNTPYGGVQTANQAANIVLDKVAHFAVESLQEVNP
ncbi:MAG: ABC-type transport auxiliary lipoprotein family protein, partial [Pseudomonadota bacterium]|nr:ABC-type transport auxiliary lipoprotein family protein [Pseudomonadota bacterium]